MFKKVRKDVENQRQVTYSERLHGRNGMQPDALWQAVLGEIELSVSHGNFVTWFKGTSLLKQSDGTIVIGVTNVFIKQQMEKNEGDEIAKSLDKIGLDR